MYLFLSVFSRLFFSLPFIVLFLTAPLLAQIPAEVEKEHRQEEQRQSTQDRITPDPNVFTPAAPPAVKIERPDAYGNFHFPEETPCFVIREIQWEGSDPFIWLRPEIIGAINQCIGAQGLKILQDYLSQRLMEEGYVTSRVIIPGQSLVTGTLQFRAVPGTIGAIQDQGKKIGTHKTIFPMRRDHLLNQRDLDHGLENIRRLKSQQEATFDLVPGSGLGETEIVINHPPSKRWNGLITLDDSGAKTTGKYQLGGTLTLDSPFYAYDALSFSINRDAHFLGRFNTRSKSMRYNIPWRHLLFNASVYQSSYKQTVAGFSSDIVYSGESQGAELGATYMLYRTGQAKWRVPFTVSHQKGRSFIDDVQVEIQYNNVTDYETGLRYSQSLGQGAIEIALLQKASLRDHSDAPGVIVGVPNWDGRYRVYSSDASLTLPFHVGSFPARYEGAWRIQHPDTPIPSRQFFFIGSRYTVRGFDGTQSLAAEEGWLFRNTLAFPMGNTGQEIYWGMDTGSVRGASAVFLPGRHLSGAALGFRGKWRSLQSDLTAGWPIDRPDPFKTKQPAYTLFLSLAF